MARDHGDSNPSDIGDVKPVAPTVDFVETNTRRIGTPDPRLSPQDTGFNSELDADTAHPEIRHIWAGSILEDYNNNTYSVLLQNGKEVVGIDPYVVPNYSFIEAQTVSVIAGQRYGEFIIVGQKFETLPTIEYIKLTEILEVHGHAKGKRQVMDANLAYHDSSDEVTVYDKFYHNYGIIGEVFPYIYDINTQTAYIIGTHGLMRLGAATEDIAKDVVGDIQIYNDVGEVESAIVEASLTWMHNNKAIVSGTQVLIKFFTEFGKWIIIGRSC